MLYEKKEVSTKLGNEMDWKPIGINSEYAMDVLLYILIADFKENPLGLSYALYVSYWNGQEFQEQGTGHSYNERLYWPEDTLGFPTYWVNISYPFKK